MPSGVIDFTYYTTLKCRPYSFATGPRKDTGFWPGARAPKQGFRSKIWFFWRRCDMLMKKAE
jgi:hypothetical protein